MITYEHHQIVVRVPTEEYRRLKKIQTTRLLDALNSKRMGSQGKKISLHDIVLEAIGNFKDE
jgi:hypothetical protein